MHHHHNHHYQHNQDQHDDDDKTTARQDIMEERLTCLEEKLSSIQLSLEMLPDLLTRYHDHDDHGDGDDGDDDDDDDKGACGTNNGRVVGEVGVGTEAFYFLNRTSGSRVSPT